MVQPRHLGSHIAGLNVMAVTYILQVATILSIWDHILHGSI